LHCVEEHREFEEFGRSFGAIGCGSEALLEDGPGDADGD